MKIKLHTNDLPNSVNFTESVAVDTNLELDTSTVED